MFFDIQEPMNWADIFSGGLGLLVMTMKYPVDYLDEVGEEMLFLFNPPEKYRFFRGEQPLEMMDILF